MKLPVAAEFTFEQEEDSNGRSDLINQTLKVAMTDAGGPPYLVLETDRWALDPDEIDAFAERLKWCAAQVRQAGEKDEEAGE